MAPKKNYSKEQLNEALAAVARGVPVATAARAYSVPRITLYYKSCGKLPVECRMGPTTVLTHEEEHLLEQWILSLAKAHHPVHKDQLLDSVQLLLQEKKRQNPFSNSRPGRKWFSSFLKRHPNLSQRVPQNLTPAREKVTEEQIRRWFEEIKAYLESKDLLDVTNDATRVFNCDESAFFLQPKSDKVLTKKGDKNIYNAGTNDDKENLTVLVTANAAGVIAPPMIVFKYLRIPSHIALSINKSWGIGRSENGWMCGQTFFEYITNVFLPWLIDKKIKRPILMFIDGHVSHMTFQLSRFCSENGIELLALYPNSTHLIQPMDVSVFKPLKALWKKCVREWHIDNHGEKLRKEHFGHIFEKALSLVTTETIQNGFNACGLSPFNVENVKFSKISNYSKENLDSITLHKTSIALEVLEKYIPKETLTAFKASKADWNGNVEDTSLFTVWKVMKNKKELIEEKNIENPESKAETEKQENDVDQPGCSGLNVQTDCVKEATPSKIIVHSVETFSPSSASYKIIKYPFGSPPTLSVLKENVPTPFKKALFWPEEIKSENKKRNKEKIPSAITSESWQEYHKKKELEKKQKQEEKEKRAEERKRKQELKMTPKPVKRKKNTLYCESSSDSEEWEESGDSMDDVQSENEEPEDSPEDDAECENEQEVNSESKEINLKFSDIKVGDFVLARFLGGKRQTFFYRYICVVQKIYNKNDIEVVSLKSTSDTSTSFRLMDNDISTIKMEDIIKRLEQPELQNIGDRIKYTFSEEIDIFEA